MTLSQAFIHITGSNEEAAQSMLSFVGLVPTDDYNPDDSSQKCALYKASLSYLSRENVGIKSISEGGYTIAYDKEGKSVELLRLANESGCEDLINFYTPAKVTNKSNLW